MSSWLWAAIALSAIPTLGLLPAVALRLRGALLLAGSWLIGAGLIAALLVTLSLLHVSYSRPAFALAWVVVMFLGATALHVHLARLATITLQTYHRAVDATALQADQQHAEAIVLQAHHPNVDPASFDTRQTQIEGTFTRPTRLDAAPVRVGHTHIAAAAPVSLQAGPGWVALPLLALCAFQIVYVWLNALRVPLGSFDAWALWEYKARLFWLHSGITTTVLRDHAPIFAHPAYPPLIPLLETWVYTWTAKADPILMKPIFPMFYLSLLLAFYAALQVRVGARLALAAAALLTLVPRLTEYAGTGLADVPLAAYLVATAAAWCALGAEESIAAITPGVFLGLALDTKRDGIIFLAAVLCVALLLRPGLRVRTPGARYPHLARLYIGKLWRNLRRHAAPNRDSFLSRLALAKLPPDLWPYIPIVGATLLIGVPWYLYAALAGLPDRDFLPITLTNFGHHADRLGHIASLFSLNLLALGEWNLLWVGAATMLLLRLVGRPLRVPVLLLLVLLPLLFYVLTLGLSAWPDYQLHVRTSLDRLIMVTSPFALWFLVEQFVPADEGHQTRVLEEGKRAS